MVIEHPKVEVEEKKCGRIIIPESAMEKQQIGNIVALGDGEDLVKYGLEVGDNVLYAKYGGTEIEIDGKSLIILNHSDILAVVG